MTLMAGSARVGITPSSPCWLAGYGARDHAHEGVHDPISMRALYVRGADSDGLLVSADLVGFPLGSIDRVLPRLEAELGLPPGNVMCCATHTHSAPVIRQEHVNAEWLAMFERQVVAAAAVAKTRLHEVVLKIGRGTCEIGTNRREERPVGAVLLGGNQVILGKNPEGPIDREVIVLAVETTEGDPVARVCNFACHGTVMGGRNYFISGDWMGLAAIGIEGESVDEKPMSAAFVFLNGGCANVNPKRTGNTDFDPAEKTAEEFRASFDEALENLEPLPAGDTVAGASSVLRLPYKLGEVESGKGKTRPVRIHGLRIGPVRIVGYPGEMFSETAIAVKEASPHPVTMVTSYNSGYYAGYAPVAEAYEKGGYEVQVTPYAEGAEAVLRRGLVQLVGET